MRAQEEGCRAAVCLASEPITANVMDQHMSRKTAFSVKLRRPATGEEHVRTIFAADESTAKERAIARARAVLPLFVERKYEPFEVLSCDASPTKIRRAAKVA